MPTLLNNMPLERANRVFGHPIHQDAYRDLAQLILALRQCRKYEDYYHFQQDLLAKVLAVQEHPATEIVDPCLRNDMASAQAHVIRSLQK